MVVIRLVGGMGNQIWGWVFGRALETLGNEVAYDVSFFENDDTRAYVLDRFTFPVRIERACGDDLTEPDLLYHPEFLRRYPRDTTLSGYWQCQKYFEAIEPQIRKEFRLRNPVSQKTLEVYRQIQAGRNSTFLHIRRSDTLAARGMDFHGLVTLAYYRRAIRYIAERRSKFALFVFSDDIAWCKENFPFPATFVDHNNPGIDWDSHYVLKRNTKGREEEDLALMAACHNGITGNSSFSWWGGWGINYPDKIVVSPRQWLTGKNNEMTRDMIPSTWARIP